MTPTPTPETLSSVDDHLGPAAQRFFGTGFRRVRYDVSDIETTCTPEAQLQGRALVGVRYPVDWSRKRSSRLRPHFSTVDALVLGARLSTLCLADAHGWRPAEAGRAQVREVRIAAGSRPQEDLSRLPVTITGRRGEGSPAGRRVSDTDCRIGTMRVRCRIEHRDGAVVPGTRRYSTPAELLGPDEEHYYGSGFTAWRQEIRDVRVDRAALRAEARLDVTADGRWVPAALPPGGVSLVDGFVTALQLAQVLLYEFDGIRREDSETLWMRQTTMTLEPTATATGVTAVTWLENAELVELAGGLWRTADIVGEIGGVRLRCAVTHRLRPGPAARAGGPTTTSPPAPAPGARPAGEEQ